MVNRRPYYLFIAGIVVGIEVLTTVVNRVLGVGVIATAVVGVSVVTMTICVALWMRKKYGPPSGGVKGPPNRIDGER